MESLEHLHVKHADVNQVTADGAGNAVGSVAEYESKTRTFRGNDVDVDVCIAHQNERSGGYASGTIEFAEPVNEELGDLLKKSHTIQTFIHRSQERMDAYEKIAESNGREPIYRPKPGIDIRWNSSIDEAMRSNLIMGDICETLRSLFEKDGFDYDLLTPEEKESRNIDRFIYTQDEKMQLRQYAAAAAPAKILSKFLQSKGNSRFSYILFYLKWTIEEHSNNEFLMDQGTCLALCLRMFVHVDQSLTYLCSS